MPKVSGDKTPHNNGIQQTGSPSQQGSGVFVPIPQQDGVGSSSDSLTSRDIRQISSHLPVSPLGSIQSNKNDSLNQVVNAFFVGASSEIRSRLVRLLNKDINALIPKDTALILACKKADPNFVRMLIELGADVNGKNNNSEPPIFVVCNKLQKQNCQETIQKLTDIIDLLLKNGANPNLILNGEVPLLLLCSQSHPNLRAIDLLLNANADVNAACEYRSPLILAAANPDPDIGIAILKKLIDKRADVNASFSIGSQYRTTLQIILEMNFSDSGEIIDLLLKAGAKFELLEGKNWEILENSVEDKPSKFTPELLRALVDSDRDSLALATKDRGKTPLMYAASSGIVDVVKHMLDLGFPVDRQDVNGCTVFDYAMAYGQSDICHLLQERMGLSEIRIPVLVTPMIHIAKNVYGPVNQDLGNEIRDRLESKSPVEITGIAFEGDVVRELEGGACVSLTMRQIKTYFLSIKEEGYSWDSILEHMKRVSDISTFNWEEIRTEQAAYNTLRVIEPKPGVDYTLNKIQAVVNFYDLKINYASAEIDVTDYQQALPLLQEELDKLPEGIFALRLLQPADNLKLEVHGHSGFYLKMGDHSALFDPNAGLLDLTGTQSEAKIMMIQCQDLYDQYSVNLLRLYQLIEE